MNKEQFLINLEIYGADQNRWPEAKRASALAFFSSDDPVILAKIREEMALDALMTRDDIQTPISIALEAKLIDLMPPPKKRFAFNWRTRLKSLIAPKWASVGFMGIALFGGIGVGYAQAIQQVELSAVNDMLAYASAEELTDLNGSQWSEPENVGND